MGRAVKHKRLLKRARFFEARLRLVERTLSYTRQRVERLEREVLDRGQIIPASLITHHRPCADHHQGDD